MKKEFRTNLSRVKALGSAKEGVSHWFSLRWTSILLLPFTLWFVIKIMRLCSSEGKMALKSFDSPFDIVCFTIFLLFSIYHGLLGMEVIIEDYIHQKFAKRMIIILLNFVSLISSISFILILLKYYII